MTFLVGRQATTHCRGGCHEPKLDDAERPEWDSYAQVAVRMFAGRHAGPRRPPGTNYIHLLSDAAQSR